MISQVELVLFLSEQQSKQQQEQKKNMMPKRTLRTDIPRKGTPVMATPFFFSRMKEEKRVRNTKKEREKEGTSKYDWFVGLNVVGAWLP
jgi:hypothetical protein